MDVKYYFPSWFVQIEMDLRFEALPVHFYIRTPRIVSRLSMYVWHWKFHWNADPKRFRQLLASRLLTVNDIDEQGRSLLHVRVQAIVLSWITLTVPHSAFFDIIPPIRITWPT